MMPGKHDNALDGAGGGAVTDREPSIPWRFLAGVAVAIIIWPFFQPFFEALGIALRNWIFGGL
jgi:hypothetical protein